MKRPPRYITATLLILATWLATGCSGKTEDVRFRLCKKVTERILESMQPITWKTQSSERRGAGDAAVRLVFTSGAEGHQNREMASACFFEHNRPEESALDHVDPLAAFSTVPYMMTIGQERVPDDLLHKAVNAEQLEGFREFFNRVTREVERPRS